MPRSRRRQGVPRSAVVRRGRPVPRANRAWSSRRAATSTTWDQRPHHRQHHEDHADWLVGAAAGARIEARLVVAPATGSAVVTAASAGDAFSRRGDDEQALELRRLDRERASRTCRSSSDGTRPRTSRSRWASARSGSSGCRSRTAPRSTESSIVTGVMSQFWSVTLWPFLMSMWIGDLPERQRRTARSPRRCRRRSR